METIQTYLLPHWPFVALMFVLATIGQVAKRVVPPSDKGWRKVFHQTLPLHPVVAGAIVGLIPGLPVSVETTSFGRSLYFALAGVCSTWAYDVVKQVFRKQGIAIGSAPPPPPPPPVA